MRQELSIHNEQMSAEELQFLVHKDEKETRNFYRVMRIFMTLCFIIPFVVAWMRAMSGSENPFDMLAYFGGVLFLLGFLGVSAWFTYSRTLQKVKTDIKDRSKTVESVRITSKTYISHNRTYYFYLDSPVKLSIEVTEADYHNLNEGDELNIEYSTNAKFYFGYF